jgi:hypothetical protein
MKEVFPGRPETETAKTNVIDFEAARHKRQAEQAPQMRRETMPPPSKEEREERNTVKRQQRIKEELGKTGGQPKGEHTEQQASGTPEDKRLFDEIFGGMTEEQINAHNEQFKARREREQAEKERLHEEALKHYTKHQERLAAMTPEERAAYERDLERTMTGLTPITPEEWKNLIRTMSANVKRQEREKAAWVAERDPRYDPMTGDLLEADEFPLSATSEYYFDGSTRPRRFIPPDSPHLKDYKPLQVEEGGEKIPESEYHERLAKRLQKAGFVEVEPTLADKASFEQTQWFRSLSPADKALYLQEAMREMTRSKAFEGAAEKETAGEKVAKIIELLINFLIALISPEVAAELEEKESTQKAA